jgi:hypothetical protein
MSLQRYAEFLKDKGHLYSNILNPKNIEDYIGISVLSRKDALEGLELLKEVGVIVMGGEVYYRKGNNFLPEYAFWECSPKVELKLEDNVLQCYQESVNYISNYVEKPNSETAYLINILNEPLEDFEKKYQHYKKTGELSK